MTKNFLPDYLFPQGVVNALHLNKEPLQTFASTPGVSQGCLPHFPSSLPSQRSCGCAVPDNAPYLELLWVSHNQPHRCLHRPQALHLWDVTELTKIKSGYTPRDSEIVVKAKAFVQISGLLGSEVWMMPGLKPIYRHLTLKDLKTIMATYKYTSVLRSCSNPG